MKTIILTRFLIDGLFSKPPLTDEQAARAERILRQALLPSLANQTFRDFEWWVIGGDRLRDVDLPAEKLILPPGACMGAAASERLAGVTGNVLSIRLDSDDAVDRGFLQRMFEAAFGATAPEVVYQTGGYVCDLRARKVVRRKYIRPSPFTGCVETSLYKTVFAARHIGLARVGFTETRIAGSQTMQFLHGGNAVTRKANHVVRPESFPGFNWERFGVDIQKLTEAMS